MAKKGHRRKEAKEAKEDKAAAKSKKDATSSATEEVSAGAGGHCGLNNLGNTCFFNSMLQCLSVSKPFSDSVIELSQNGVGSLGTALANVFLGIRGLGCSKGKAFSPKPLLSQITPKCPWFKVGAQQDAHELLRSLLGLLSDELTSNEKSAKRQNTPKLPGNPVGACEELIWDCFKGHVYSSVLCWDCHTVSVTLDPFLDLSVDMPAEGGKCGPMGIPLEAMTVSASLPQKHGKEQTPASGSDGTLGDVDENSEDADDASSDFEFSFALKRGSETDSWGFQWSKDDLASDRLVVGSITKESILDQHNLKRRSVGDEDGVVRPGDSVVKVDKATDFPTMKRLFKSKEKLKLAVTFSRPSPNKENASDGEDEASPQELRATYASRANDLLSRLPPTLREDFGAEQEKLKSDGRCQLSDCLRRFTGVEALDEDLRPIYQCSTCAKKASKKDAKPRSFASRRVWLWPNLPPLLTVQVKCFHRRGTKYEKSKKTVELPPMLDLSEFVLDAAQHRRLLPHLAADAPRDELPTKQNSHFRYELYAICVHLGSSLQSGHYIAYVNAGPSLAREKWYMVSDTSVSSCSRDTALKSEAYVAFYRREGLIGKDKADDRGARYERDPETDDEAEDDSD